MRVLTIMTRIPWPLSDGARIVMNQAVQGIVDAGHHVEIVALESEPEPFDRGELDGIASLHVVPVRTLPRALDAARTIFRDRPTTQLRREAAGVESLLDRLVTDARRQGRGHDVVISDQSHIARYGAYVAERYDLPYLFRSHNVEHEIWQRHLDQASASPVRPWLRVQTERWRRFEVDQMSRADLCATITPRDAETINRLLPELPTNVIPAGVDLKRYRFTDVEERDPGTLVLLGGMDWAPNRDAALWFVREILPIVRQSKPDVAVRIIGKHPPEELQRAGEGVRVEGFVDDIRTVYADATIGVVPLRVGGGMRVKIVEMMGAGLPVVATSIAAEGNVAIAPTHYRRADTAESIAAEIIDLLDDTVARSRLAHDARAFAEQTYSLAAISRSWDDALSTVADLNASRNRNEVSHR